MNIKDELLAMSEKDERQIHAFENRIEDSVKSIQDSAKTNVAMKDAYGNSLLSIGNDDRSAHFSNYTFTNDTLNCLSGWLFIMRIGFLEEL